MHFSIIIPSFNEASSIQPFLLALQPLRYSLTSDQNKNLNELNLTCEIIIVDGGSTDNTLAIASPLVDIAITSSKGRGIQMNNGVKHAKGETLIFLHADTYLPDKALQFIDLSLSQNTAVWGRFDITLKGKPLMLKVISALMNWRSRITGIATGDQVIFVNKSVFEQIRGYPNIPLMEDISLCKKLKKISSPLCLRQKVISSGRRWEQFGVFKTILLMWSLRLRYFLGQSPELLYALYSRGLFWKP